jgi:hypothetical protein
LSSHHLDNPDIPGNEAFPFGGNYEAAPFTQTLNYSAAHVLFPACKTQDGLSPIFFGVSCSGSDLPFACSFLIPP